MNFLSQTGFAGSPRITHPPLTPNLCHALSVKPEEVPRNKGGRQVVPDSKPRHYIFESVRTGGKSRPIDGIHVQTESVGPKRRF